MWSFVNPGGACLKNLSDVIVSKLTRTEVSKDYNYKNHFYTEKESFHTA